ncbi:hypothetical protein BAE44_0025449 [Dichanthelium oligosanthes]|uniref:Uncharacterized protein n=1 Tax=Dichanthelium oligosanthes TaxID=888268 RepID=A0A1E5UKZ1_9POAL|nr:hypothetical protein BAE44_0025449 [Dichanthelium oligosanthes]
MKTRDLAFTRRPRLLMVQRRLYRLQLPQRGLRALRWRARRAASLPSAASRTEQEVTALVDQVLHTAAAGSVVNLSDTLIGYCKAIVSRVVFGDGGYGLDGDAVGEKLRRVLDELHELVLASPMSEIAPWLGWVDTLTAGLEAKTRRSMACLLDQVVADHPSRRLGGRHAPADGEVDDHRDFVGVVLDVNEMDKDAGLRLGTDNIISGVLYTQLAGVQGEVARSASRSWQRNGFRFKIHKQQQQLGLGDWVREYSD